MIEFKKTLEKGSKIYYKFSTAGLRGILVIDKESLLSEYDKLEGFNSNNSKEKERLLYIASKNLSEKNFPEKYTYAFC